MVKRNRRVAGPWRRQDKEGQTPFYDRGEGMGEEFDLHMQVRLVAAQTSNGIVK